MRVRYDAEAREELQQAVRWYEAHRGGLGARFHANTLATERLVAQSPSAYVAIDPGSDPKIRRAPVQDFPYALLYMEHGGELWILTVMHLNRRPGYWQKRASRLRPAR